MRKLPNAHPEGHTDISVEPITQLNMVPQPILKYPHNPCAKHMRMRTSGEGLDQSTQPTRPSPEPELSMASSTTVHEYTPLPGEKPAPPTVEPPGWATQYTDGTRPVTTAMVPGLEGQTFMDLQRRWTSEYKFKSRRGAAKPNNRIWAEYSVYADTELYDWPESAKKLGGTKDGPIIAVAPVYNKGVTSTTLQIAGRTIPVEWNSAWLCSWDKTPITKAHPAWESGLMKFSTDEETATGVFTGANGKSISFRAIRSRPIGGINRWSLFSPRRRTQPIIADVKKMPFPPTNQERYWPAINLPPAPPPGRIWKSWSAKLDDGIPIFSDSGLQRFRKFVRKVHTARKACMDVALKLEGRKSLTIAEVQKILKITPLPKDELIEIEAVHPTLRQTLLIERADGSIQEILPRSRPLLPGAVNRNADTIRRMFREDHPWLDLSVPDYLDLGFPHDAHDTSFAILMQASGQKFHQHILHWVNALVKEKAKTHLNAFTNLTKDTPPAIGGAVVVKRGMNIKPNNIDWRPTVNHRSPESEDADTVPKEARGGPAPAGDDLMIPPPSMPTVRNDKGLPYSTNERICPTMCKYPPIQYPTPADVGLVACIYLAWRVVIKFSTYDIEGCFHRKSVEPRRAAESQVIEDALAAGLVDGMCLSNIVDFGYLDSADISERVTGPIPKMLDRTMNLAIKNDEARKMTIEENEFRHERGKLFGIDSSEAFLSRSLIYVDDLGNFHPEGYTELCDKSVLDMGEEMGYKWEIDKNQDGSYIGFEFTVCSMDKSGCRLRDKKAKKYTATQRSMATRKATTREILMSRQGEASHAAQVELDIKPLLEPYHATLHVKPEDTRFDNPDLLPVTKSLASSAIQIADILERGEGIPLFCDIRRPWHYETSTLTQRTDASLPSAEETSTYNGFGGWFLSRTIEGMITIHAFYGEWTTLEKQKFAGCIAAAEGVTVVFGSILTKAHSLLQKHHKNLLQLTDSLVAEMKYNKMSYGNAMIEKSRVKWETHSKFDTGCAYLDYIPREWNVGGDLLSKGHWDTFCAVCMAAGLPMPILIELTPAQRDISYLWA